LLVRLVAYFSRTLVEAAAGGPSHYCLCTLWYFWSCQETGHRRQGARFESGKRRFSARRLYFGWRIICPGIVAVLALARHSSDFRRYSSASSVVMLYDALSADPCQAVAPCSRLFGARPLGEQVGIFRRHPFVAEQEGPLTPYGKPYVCPRLIPRTPPNDPSRYQTKAP
jgi:hypothetical protein